MPTVLTAMSVLLGGAEFNTVAKEVQFSATCAELDSTNYASGGWTEVEPGLKSAQLAVQMMADPALDAIAWSQFATARVPMSVALGTSAGSLAYLGRGCALGYTPTSGEVGTLAMGTIDKRATGVAARGMLLHPSATERTSSGTGTAVQIGAVDASKAMYAALHVITAAGTTPSLTVKVQSDNAEAFSSPTDRITFTSASTSATYQWDSAAGAITDDWWRITWTISGTSPSFYFGVTAGIF